MQFVQTEANVRTLATITPGDSKDDMIHLIVIGAGVAGLSAAISTRLGGHAVTVLERSAKLEEIGAGLQITPNATRIFRHWQILESVDKLATKPTALSVRRYDGTQLLAHESDLQSKVYRQYGNPFLDIRRSDLQAVMLARAQELGVIIRMSQHVRNINLELAEVELDSGERIRGDVVLGADGLWSQCRGIFLGQDDQPQPTGDLAYRIQLNVDHLADPTLRALVSQPTVNFWIGPGAHVVGYSVRNATEYNLVLLVPDDLGDNVRKAEGNIGEMRALFQDWDPLLRSFLDHVDTVEKWRLFYRKPLHSWRSAMGTFILAGDSCHPMLPYLAQGANSAIEDGAVLGRLLGHIQHKSLLPDVTQLYEKLRKRRSETIVRETFAQRGDFHMDDGSDQRTRDAIFLDCLDKGPTAPFPSRWTCPKVQPWLWGYDAIKDTDQELAAYTSGAPLSNQSKRIAVVSCSTRAERLSPYIAEYIQQIMVSQTSSDLAVLDLVDLAKQNLPLYDEPAEPRSLPTTATEEYYSHEHTKEWSVRIQSFDAFIFVTPQYNWSIPAALKNALDFLYWEWTGKIAAIVSFGSKGGGKAAEHLHQILTGLCMQVVNTKVGLITAKGLLEDTQKWQGISPSSTAAWQQHGVPEHVGKMYSEVLERLSSSKSATYKS